MTNALTLLQLLPTSDSAKDAKILTLRHQITMPERQPHREQTRSAPANRASLAAPPHKLPHNVLHRIHPPIRPYRAALAPQPARPSTHGNPAPQRAGRPPTMRSIRTPVLRPAHENNS